MKTILFILSFLPVLAIGQIEFKHISLEEGKKLAKKENKPLFVDVYASWCGPCKYMANTTFKDAAVGEYYNKHFVCIKIDGEKEDGPTIMTEYAIEAYPTLLYFAPDGKLSDRFLGAMDVQTAKKMGIKIIEPDKDPDVLASKAFHSSKKEKSDLVNYINQLSANGGDSLKFYSDLYYAKNPNLDLTKEFDFLIFEKSESNFQSESTKTFLSRLDSFDPKRASDKMVSFILGELELSKKSGNFENCEKAIRLFYEPLKTVNVMEMPELEELINQLKMESEAY